MDLEMGLGWELRKGWRKGRWLRIGRDGEEGKAGHSRWTQGGSGGHGDDTEWGGYVGGDRGGVFCFPRTSLSLLPPVNGHPWPVPTWQGSRPWSRPAHIMLLVSTPG